MRLSKMFKNAPKNDIRGLSSDSRTVKKGDMYFCMPGITFDGHDFIDEAIEKGAVCIVHSNDLNPDMIRDGVIYIKVMDVVEALNHCARIFYGKPTDKMTMYGITGTNGKSTIATIIKHIRDIKEPCGYIGTIAIEYGNTKLQPDLTTPDVLVLQHALSEMVSAGMKACALEVSSHGLAQRRVDAIQFDVAVFTNFTYDHLDYHGSMESYLEAKSLLFKSRVKPEGVSVLNIDDPHFEDMNKVSQARVVTYGIQNECDYRAINVKLDSSSSSFDLVVNDQIYPVQTNLVAEYNIYNLLASIASLHQTDMDMETIIKACKNLPQVEGRLEQIDLGQPFHCIVDFAHTPDGMEKVMEFGRKIATDEHKVIAVFGSAGKRDVSKRKVFGELATKYCDFIILTEDDPRDED
ncbi:MAG: UDP-N-acetylmuramoyl-L-alanyl-D-glutamate--2,6-diaminopimelate ligase, partial [Erysipelotrichaceae bacterium]|nr:UDP-N-acetylmuramoyl-L-alanyl-D-glutamate--2,6-diaminopimelate ligase [Erysipelotrichaceae bacterium]